MQKNEVKKSLKKKKDKGALCKNMCISCTIYLYTVTKLLHKCQLSEITGKNSSLKHLYHYLSLVYDFRVMQ